MIRLKPFLPFLLVTGFFGTLNLIKTIYPDILWFDSFGFLPLWTLMFKNQILFFSGFFVLTFIFLWLNLRLARRLSSKTVSDEQPRFNSRFSALNTLFSQLYQRSRSSMGQELSGPIFALFSMGGVLLVSVLVGLMGKEWWHDFYAFFHQVSFNLSDPIFAKDVSFYVFSLPVLSHIQNLGLVLMVVALALSGFTYFSQNILLYLFSSSTQNRGMRVHLMVLLSGLAVMLAMGVWLRMYDLLYSSRGVVFGAGYTDVTAQLLAYKVMMLGFLVVAVLFVFAAFTRKVLFPFVMLLGVFGISVVLGGVYPTIIQNYVVAPNELGKERQFIEHNISFTRKAYGLDTIDVVQFPVKQNLTVADIQDNDRILKNIRLWNQDPLKQTFSQLQEIRLYYEFFNIDVDRYMVGDGLEQVMVSPREMDTSQLTAQAQTWINQHLVYTHGYGAVMSPVSQVSKEGLPHFYVKDIPPSTKLTMALSHPEIYFGEHQQPYAIVNTEQKEFDYPKGDKNVYTHYDGPGGIQLDSFLKRLVYAIKFSDLKILISSLINDKSRLMYDRDIKTMSEKLFPFIIFDRDPYIVLRENGRMVWMLDGYTLTERYPYSEPLNGRRGGINYIRNSVKVTIDAYSGEVIAYEMDNGDPLIDVYSKVYPGVFQPFSTMPSDLQAHIRYPKDLFTLQSRMYSTYHMTDPQVFYNREDLWSIPQETYGEDEKVMDAYYMVTRIPGESKDSFVLMMPFTPTNKNNMIAWLSAKCDLDAYGALKVFTFPKERTIYGPMQIESRIDQDTDISQKLTLWGQMGSRVIRGNLMVVPINESLIYVEPIYLQATQSKLPELKRVIFAYDDSVVMDRDLDSAIGQIFTEEVSIEAPVISVPSRVVKSESLDAAIDAMILKYGQIRQSFSKGKWQDFGRAMDDLDGLMKEVEGYRKVTE